MLPADPRNGFTHAVSAPRTQNAAWLTLFLGAAVVVAGCPEPDRARPATPASTIEPAQTTSPDPWPVGERTLEDALEEFDEDQCPARMRASMSVEVGELLADLGYDSAVADLCTALAAAKTKDASRCETLTTTVVRRSCLRRVALVSGEANDCGIGEERGALCIAYAHRDPRLCAAVPAIDRTRCIAVLTANPDACGDAESSKSIACRREVARVGSYTGADDAPSPEIGLQITLRDGGETVLESSTLGPRGVVLSRGDGCPSSSLVVPRGLDRSEPRVELIIGLDPPRLMPGSLYFEADAITGLPLVGGEIQLTPEPSAVGESVSVEFTSTIELLRRRLRLSVQIATFVRDVRVCPS